MFNLIAMNVAAWLCIAAGLATFLSATRQNVSATSASLGVFMIFLGFNVFYVLRIKRLESRVTQLPSGSSPEGDGISGAIKSCPAAILGILDNLGCSCTNF